MFTCITLINTNIQSAFQKHRKKEQTSMKLKRLVFKCDVGTVNMFLPEHLRLLGVWYGNSSFSIYSGPRSWRAFKVMTIIWKSVLEVMARQCRVIKTGVICSVFLVLLRSLAAEFFTIWSRFNAFWLIPVKRPLQQSHRREKKKKTREKLDHRSPALCLEVQPLSFDCIKYTSIQICNQNVSVKLRINHRHVEVIKYGIFVTNINYKNYKYKQQSATKQRYSYDRL